MKSYEDGVQALLRDIDSNYGDDGYNQQLLADPLMPQSFRAPNSRFTPTSMLYQQSQDPTSTMSQPGAYHPVLLDDGTLGEHGESLGRAQDQMFTR